MSQEEINKDGKPTPTSEQNQSENKDTPVEVDPTLAEDADFEKELEALETEDEPQKPQKRTELEKAIYTAKSTLKRIEELGGDISEITGEEKTPVPAKPETEQYVTKLDLAKSEAEKMAKTPGEAKLIMWYVKNRGMSVSDAHFLANKGKIQKTLSEINRAKDAKPNMPNGGAGGRAEDKTDAPDLNDGDKQRLIQSGMVYDPAKKAYVGKKIQHRYDEASKTWVTEKV